MKHLNNLPGFDRVFIVPPGERGITLPHMAKVSICAECFWIRNCQDYGTGLYTGIVDNYPVHTDIHGLRYDDLISFMLEDRSKKFRKPPIQARQYSSFPIKFSRKENIFNFCIAMVFVLVMCLSVIGLFSVHTLHILKEVN